MEVTDIQKLGVGLGGFGLFFMLLGVMLLFDKGNKISKPLKHTFIIINYSRSPCNWKSVLPLRYFTS